MGSLEKATQSLLFTTGFSEKATERLCSNTQNTTAHICLGPTPTSLARWRFFLSKQEAVDSIPCCLQGAESPFCTLRIPTFKVQHLISLLSLTLSVCAAAERETKPKRPWADVESAAATRKSQLHPARQCWSYQTRNNTERGLLEFEGARLAHAAQCESPNNVCQQVFRKEITF